jgi:hypothetical protein
MNRIFKNKAGLTMMELLIATLLMGVVFLGISSVYLAARKLYVAASERVIIGYELQYASQHIYKTAMRAIGDKATPAISVPLANTERVEIRMNTVSDIDPTISTDPLTRNSYLNNVMTYSYYRSDDKLMFDKGTPADLSDDESLVPKVAVTAVSFTQVPGNNVVTGSITATYGTQTLTFYFSCYPRLSSFN